LKSSRIARREPHDRAYMWQSVAPKPSRTVCSEHLSIPSFTDFSDGTFRWVLIRPFLLCRFVLDPMFAKLGLEFRVPSDLFVRSVTDQCLGCSVILYEPINRSICVSLLLYRIRSRKEFLVGKHLTISFAVYRIASHVHRVRCEYP
jgi:hypothetical protein